MIAMNDIYHKIDSNLIKKNFWEVDTQRKKELINQELKMYIISKLVELNASNIIIDNPTKEWNVIELLEVLASKIPSEHQNESISHLTHYIINVASSLQHWSITWWEENDEKLIKQPLLEIDENERWTDLKTHKDTDAVQTFALVYDAFYYKFMKENKCCITKIKKKSM